MPKELRDALQAAGVAAHRNWWFYILSGVAVLLLIASFLVPPMGVIDGSVLGAVGEIFGFAALGAFIKAMDMGIDAKVTHGDTTLQIGNDADEQ